MKDQKCPTILMRRQTRLSSWLLSNPVQFNVLQQEGKIVQKYKSNWWQTLTWFWIHCYLFINIAIYLFHFSSFTFKCIALNLATMKTICGFYNPLSSSKVGQQSAIFEYRDCYTYVTNSSLLINISYWWTKCYKNNFTGYLTYVTAIESN